MEGVKEKKHTFDERLKEPGRFQNTEHRRVFIYTWLDTAKYVRECKNCGEQVEDLVQHGLENCKKLENHRKFYILRMKLYDVPQRVKLLEKKEVLEAALAKKSLMKVLCEFLIEIWKWNLEEGERQ